MRTIEVTRTYVELKPQDFHPACLPDPSLQVAEVHDFDPAFWRFLYTEVGRANHWTDRAAWTNEQIRRHFAQPGVSLHLLSCHAAPAGYFELVCLDDGGIEINYLGILPYFQGHGLGKHLLSIAVQTCFARGANRVQLDTCTLDHPSALANYLKRGFRPYMTEKFFRQLPDNTPLQRTAS